MTLDLHAIAERYHRALDAKPGKGDITADGIAAITDSVADVPELVAEVERLTRWKSEALPVMDDLQELGQALGLPLGALITGPLAYVAAEALNTRAEAAEATIDCVRDLADWHETKAEKARRYPGSEPEIMAKAASVHDDAARRIRRALSGQS